MTGPDTAANPFRKSRHLVQYRVHFRHDVLAVHSNGRPFRSTQRDVKDRAVLSDIDLVAAEHGVDLVPQTAFVGQLQKKRNCLVGDAVFRIIQIEPGAFHNKAFAALVVLSKELSKMQITNLLEMGFESFPSWTARQRLNGWSHLYSFFS